MRSVAECQRRKLGAVWLELVRIVEDSRIPVGGGEHHKDRFASADGDLADEVVTRGGAAHSLDGAVEAQQLTGQSVADGVDASDSPGAVTPGRQKPNYGCAQ